MLPGADTTTSFTEHPDSNNAAPDHAVLEAAKLF